MHGVPIVYDSSLGQQEATFIAPARLAQQIPEAVQPKKTLPEKFPGFKDSTGVAPLPAEQMREVVNKHDFQPTLDLSQINAPNPEPEPRAPADESQGFPAPPTQCPSQEGEI